MSNDYNILTVPIDLGGIWHWGWAVGLTLCLLYKLRPKVEWILQAYVVVMAIATIEGPQLRYGDYTRAFQATAGACAIEILLIVSVASTFHAKLWKLVPILAIAECIGVWYQRAGLMGWESFDTALIALCLPFSGWAVQLLGVATIATHHGFTAWMIFVVEVAAYIEWKKCHWSIYPAIGIPAALAAFIMIQPTFHFSTGVVERLYHWDKYMSLWVLSGWQTWFIGTGPGSFQWISLIKEKAVGGPIFLQMHSDWLQILFETGLIGFALACAVVFRAARGLKDKPTLAGVFGVVVFGLTYHPLRFFPSAFLCAMIFARALYREHARMSINDWRFLKLMKDLKLGPGVLRR